MRKVIAKILVALMIINLLPGIGIFKPFTASAASVTDFPYTGDAQAYLVPADGYYKLEAWGAGGGGISLSNQLPLGGKGGYSSGDRYLTAGSIIYIYVGGEGKGEYVGSGGGGTDFRTSILDLNSRILVAGGGGGGNRWIRPYTGTDTYYSDMGAGGNFGERVGFFPQIERRPNGNEFQTIQVNQSADSWSAVIVSGEYSVYNWSPVWQADKYYRSQLGTSGQGGSGGIWYAPGDYGTINLYPTIIAQGGFNGGGGAADGPGGGGGYVGGGGSAGTYCGGGAAGTSYIGGVVNGVTALGTYGNGKARITRITEAPTINITSPTNGIIVKDTLPLQGTVSDANTGDVISTKYNIDGGTTQTVAGTVTTSGAFTNTNINVSALANGAHILNTWAQDNSGEVSATTSRSFTVDKVNPTVTSNNVDYSWKNSNITVALTYADALSGINLKKYEVLSSATPTGTYPLTYSTPIVISANGTYYIHYSASDIAGNVVTGTYGPYKLDKTQGTVTSNNTDYNWKSSNITVALTYADALSGISLSKYELNTSSTPTGTYPSTYTAPIVISTNSATNYIHYSGTDNAGNVVTGSYGPYKLDKTLATVTSSNTDYTWKSSNITVGLSYTDGLSGMNLSQYELSTNVTPTGTYPTSYTVPIIISTNGAAHYIHYKGTDVVGNVVTGSFGPYKLDKTQGTVTADNTDYTWKSSDITVNLTYADALSGVNLRQYELSTSATPTGTYPSTYTVPIVIATEGDSNYIHYKGTDNAGNVVTGTYGPYKVDKTIGTITADDTNYNWRNADITVALSYDGGLSGNVVGEYELSTSATPSGAYVSYSTPIVISTEGDSNYIHTRSVDGAGNVTTSTFGPYKLDKVVGEVTSDNTDYTWKNTDITVGLTYTDLLSGIVISGYELSTSATPSGTYVGYSIPIIITTEGSSNYIHYRGVDEAGNEITGSFGPYKLDKNDVIVTSDNLDYSWKKTDITVNLTYFDATGNVVAAEYEISTSDTPSGTYVPYSDPIVINTESVTNYIHYRAVDEAGNEVIGSFGPYMLDKTNGDVISSNEDYNWKNADITVELTYIDGLSDVYVKEYELSTSDTPSGTYIPYSDPITISTEGDSNYIHYKLVDNAGNETIGTFGPYKLDKVNPEAVLDNIDFSWMREDITVNISFSDILSALNVVEYELNSSDTPTGVYIPYVGTITITNESDMNYIHYRAVDNAGNEITATVGPYKLDKTSATPPVIMRSPDQDIYVGDYEITVVPGIDGLSVVDKTMYKLSGAVVQDWTDYTVPLNIAIDGLVTIEAKSIDVAGNESTSFTTVFSYDQFLLDAQNTLLTAETSYLQADKDAAQSKFDLLPLEAPERVALQVRLSLVQEVIDIKTAIGSISSIQNVQTLWPRIEALPSGHMVIPVLKTELISQSISVGLVLTKADVDIIQGYISSFGAGGVRDGLQALFNPVKTPILLDWSMQSLTDSIAGQTSQGTVTIDLASLPLGQTSTFTIAKDDIELYSTNTSGHVPLLSIKEGFTYTFVLTHSDGDGELGSRTLVQTVSDLTKPVIMGAYMLNGKIYVLAGDNYKLAENPFEFTLTSDGSVIASNTVSDQGFSTEVVVVGDGEVEIIQKKDGVATVSVPSQVSVKVSDLAGLFVNGDFNITKANEVLYGTVPASIISQIEFNNIPIVTDFFEQAPTQVLTSKPANVSGITLLDTQLDLATAQKVVDALTRLDIATTSGGTNSQTASMEVDFANTLGDLAKASGIENPSYRITVLNKTTLKLVYTSTLLTSEKLVIPDLADSTEYIIRITLVDGTKELAFREIEQETLDATAPIIERMAIEDGMLTVFASDNKGLNATAYSFDLDKSNVSSVTPLRFGSASKEGVYIELMPRRMAGNSKNGWSTEVWTKDNRLTDLDVGTKVNVKVRDQSDNYTETSVVITNEDTIINTTVNLKNPLILYPNMTLSLADLLADMFKNMNTGNATSQKQSASSLEKLLKDLKQDGFTYPEIEELMAIKDKLASNYELAKKLLDSLSVKLGDNVKYQASAVSLSTLLERLKSYVPFDINNMDKSMYDVTTSDPNIGYFDTLGNLILVSNGQLVITITNKVTGEKYSYAIIVDQSAFDRRVMVQVNSMTDLAHIFSSALVRELGTASKIVFSQVDPRMKNSVAALAPVDVLVDGVANENVSEIEIVDENVLKVGNVTGLNTLYASNGKKTVPLYVVVFESEEPFSMASGLSAPVAFTIKEGNTFSINDVIYLRNRLGSDEGTNGSYVVVETSSENVKVVDSKVVSAIKEGVVRLSVIDLISKSKMDVSFWVESLKTSIFNDTSNADVIKLGELGIVRGNGDGSFMGDKKATIAEFLTFLNRAELYKGRSGNVGYKVLDMSDSHWAYYNVQAALSGLSAYEAEDILGMNVDKQVNRNMISQMLRIKGINVDTSFIEDKSSVTRYELAKLFASMF